MRYVSYDLKQKSIFLLFIFSCVFAILGLGQTAGAADYAFPVIGSSSYSNDFNAPRSNGPHHAIDIIAKKRQKIVSRTDGVITFVGYPQPSWGYAVMVRASNGYEYWYLHMNNDTPGTDDGKGGGYYAYAPDMKAGNQVVKGQLLGYVGDSGNAENTVSHLHFEVVKPNDDRVNPYNGLRNNSYKVSNPVLDYPRIADEIMPSSVSFTGGYTLSFGNVDGNGDSELIVGAGPGGKYVNILEKDGSAITRFQPNGSTFLGGVDVAAGDVDGDGTDEIITGAGVGGKYVKIFESDGSLIKTINPYNSTKGIHVAAGNLDSDNRLEIITGARKGGEPRVNTYNLDGSLTSSRDVYNSSFRGGVRVEAENVELSTSTDEIITVSEQDGSARAKITSVNGDFFYSDYFSEEWWKGYYDIATSPEGDVYSSMGVNRRSTIRPVPLD